MSSCGFARTYKLSANQSNPLCVKLNKYGSLTPFHHCLLIFEPDTVNDSRHDPFGTCFLLYHMPKLFFALPPFCNRVEVGSLCCILT